MRKYLELFKEGFPSDMSDRTAIKNWPYVGHDINGGVVYTVIPAKEDEPEIDLTIPYVTFTAEEDNSSIGLNRLSSYQTLEYSTDTNTWSTFNKSTNISLNKDDKVYVRGVLSADNTSKTYTQFKMTGKIAASGNCNALWNKDDLNAPLKQYCGGGMFSGCTSLTTAPELPATTLAFYCYNSIFNGCTSLTTAPELPATTLTKGCYQYMFKNCTSLTQAPELPATTLATYCYYSMFEGCTGLTKAPELPITTLASVCYDHMFAGCTSLTQAPELPATTLVNSCYSCMFKGCTGLTQAPELPATTLTTSCYASMFAGCTSLTQAPELPATKLVSNCYNSMFKNCTNLNYIKCLATDISATNCITNWVLYVSSTGTFIKHPDMTSWTTGIFSIPEGWTVVDAEL